MRIVPSVKDLDPYRELPNSLRSTRLLFSSASPATPNETQTTLASLLASTPDPTAPGPSIQTLTTKLSTSTKSVALVNPQKQSAAAQKKALALARREKEAVRGQTVGLLSRKEAKRKGVWVPKRGEVTWEGLQGLGTMWEDYMVELLGVRNARRTGDGSRWEGNAENLQAKIVKADFTGSCLKVTNAHHLDLIGVEGIVIHETENTFKLVTRRNQVKVVPKRHTTFTFSIPLPSPSLNAQPSTSASASPALSPVASRPSSPGVSKPKPEKRRRMQFDLYGSQFLFRNSDRAGRKFKSKAGTEIWDGLG